MKAWTGSQSRGRYYWTERTGLELPKMTVSEQNSLFLKETINVGAIHELAISS